MSKVEEYRIDGAEPVDWKAIHDAYFEELAVLAIEEMQRIINEEK